MASLSKQHTNNMQEIVAEYIREHLMTHVVLIALTSASIVGAMIVDFVSGLRKARERGEATTSKGLKRTAAKATKYFTPYAVLMFIDIISSAVIPVPVFSMLWGIYCILCEFLSVREKSWQKAELRKAERTMRIIVENKEDVAKMASELIFSDESDKVHSCPCNGRERTSDNCRPQCCVQTEGVEESRVSLCR